MSLSDKIRSEPIRTQRNVIHVSNVKKSINELKDKWKEWMNKDFKFHKCGGKEIAYYSEFLDEIDKIFGEKLTEEAQDAHS